MAKPQGIFIGPPWWHARLAGWPAKTWLPAWLTFAVLHLLNHSYLDAFQAVMVGWMGHSLRWWCEWIKGDY